MTNRSNMKKLPLTLAACLGLTTGASAQVPGQQPNQFSDRLQTIIQKAGHSDKPDDSPKFNLNFAGGSPKALVAAIEKASGKPLNAIVPNEYDVIQLPPMKLNGVTASAVFQALSLASARNVPLPGGYSTASYFFQTRGEGENAVWYFTAPLPQEPVKYCRFYQLADFLDTYKIEDITTAIKTGWQLIGVKSAPELKFHPETKLLIAVGSTDELQTIESVLQELRKGAGPRPPLPPAGISAPIPVQPRLPAKNDGASNKP